MFSHEVDVCIANKGGLKALQHAAQYAPDPYDFSFVFTQCLSPGKSARDFVTPAGESLIHFAALGGKLSSIEMLISSHDIHVDLQTQSGWTPLMYALLPKCHSDNLYSLGTLRQSVQVAKLLLSYGANPVIITSDGWTPLHALALHMEPDLNGLARSLPLELISCGAPVDSPVPALSPKYQTSVMGKVFQNPGAQWQNLPLLHFAAQHGAVGVLRALIKSGANVAKRDKYGQTPVDAAVESEFLKKVDT